MPTNQFAVSVMTSSPPTTRGGAGAPPIDTVCQSVSISWAWGSEPSQASVVYLGTQARCTRGDYLRIRCGPHVFHGNCVDDVLEFGSGGRARKLTFVDNRDYLKWDTFYGAFNKEYRVRGVKRYKHLLPNNFNAWRWTYTNTPYTAAQILDFVFTSATVQDSWARVYHIDQFNFPVYDIDYSSGGKLNQVLQDISDKHGLLFTLLGGPWRLVWGRKGEGTLPVIPSGSEACELGECLSGNPTRIRVIGDRNLYQVHNISMVQDWKPAWQQFYDFNIFAEDIYQRGTTKTEAVVGGASYPPGTPFKTIGNDKTNDPDQVVARQLALARALEITVSQYADLRGDSSFLDSRKFSGRPRNDMPAELYINHILFRAFRFPSGFTVRNVNGEFCPIESLTIAQKMVARVTHDPATGFMTWDTTENPDGNGYAVIQGYQVGHDLFRTIKPERFRIQDWNNVQNMWERIDFQPDDSGEEDNHFILFDEPVINSADLVKMVDGYAVFKATPVFTVPRVMVSLCFEAEKFSCVRGSGNRDECHNESGLYSSFVSHSGNSPIEVPFFDGLYGYEKGQIIADAMLSRQFSYAKGKHKRYIPANNGVFPAATQLTTMHDRITVESSPEGVTETIYLTAETPRQIFIPERDLERGEAAKQLFPGQQELRQRANVALLTAKALATDAKTRKTVTDAFHGFFASDKPPVPQHVTGNGTPTTLPVGTVLRKEPNKLDGQNMIKTSAVLPGDSTSVHTEFAGIVTRDGEAVADTGATLKVAKEGEVLALVLGPVDVGDPLGFKDGQGYLSNASDYDAIGTARQKLDAPSVSGTPTLIRVLLGQGGGDDSPPVYI